MGQWHIVGAPCGPEGQNNTLQAKRRLSRALRVPHANYGEFVGIVNRPPDKRPPSGKLWDAITYLLWKDPLPLTTFHEAWNSQGKTGGGRIFVPQRTGVFHCFANSI